MPDITMCNNETCTLKERCYRHTAIPDDYWQSWAFFEQNEDGTCDNFYPTAVEYADSNKTVREFSPVVGNIEEEELTPVDGVMMQLTSVCALELPSLEEESLSGAKSLLETLHDASEHLRSLYVKLNAIIKEHEAQ